MLKSLYDGQGTFRRAILHVDRSCYVCFLISEKGLYRKEDLKQNIFFSERERCPILAEDLSPVERTDHQILDITNILFCIPGSVLFCHIMADMWKSIFGYSFMVVDCYDIVGTCLWSLYEVSCKWMTINICEMS